MENFNETYVKNGSTYTHKDSCEHINRCPHCGVVDDGTFEYESFDFPEWGCDGYNFTWVVECSHCHKFYFETQHYVCTEISTHRFYNNDTKEYED